MPRNRRTFTEEFKRQLVQLYNNGKRRKDIIEEYELNASTFDKWVKAINSTGSTKAADNRTAEENELIRLRKENYRLQMENDILKQAALIMGRKSKS